MRLAGSDWRIKAGLAVCLFLVVLRFGLIPLYEWQDETVQKIKVLQKVVAQKKALIGNEGRLNTVLQKAETSFNGAMKFYYTGFSDLQALQLVLQKKIEAVSAVCGVKIKSTNWLQPSVGYISQAPIRIRCEAGPVQIIKFIRAIEGDTRFITIDRLRITGIRTGEGLNAEFVVSAYGVKKRG